MSLSKKLESFLRRWAIPNPTAIIIAGQVILYLFMRLNRNVEGGFDPSRLMLLPGMVLQGEVWRLGTFIFFPPLTDSIFVIFFWLLFYRYGTALEEVWGTYRLNLFLWTAILSIFFSHVIVWALAGDLAIVMAQGFVLNLTHGIIDITTFTYGTVFLAFARLFPDFIINMMFVLPIRIRWLALLAWIGYGYVFLRGEWPVKVLVAGALVSYILFLGREHIREWKQGHRRRSFQARAVKVGKPIHKCLVCGLDSEASPKTSFRYCSKCAGQCCYCPEHIQNHEHITSEAKTTSDE
jgi:hypothetical protein